MSADRRGHIVELQSLRGVAAVVVMLSHPLTIGRLPWGEMVALGVILNAHSAVILFFVLSGYVLHASLAGAGMTGISIARFLVRRVLRIYPALIVATILAALVAYGLGSWVPPNSSWLDMELAARRVGWLRVGLSMLALSAMLLPPAWTLSVELVGSACMPLIAAAARSRAAFLALLGLLTAASLGLMRSNTFALSAFGYLVDFAIGSSVYQLTGPLRAAGAARPRIATAAAIIATLGLFFSRDIIKLVTLGFLTPLIQGFFNPVPSLAEGVFAGLLIAAIVAHPQGSPVLRTRPLAWLGDVSFSVYVLHFPVMIAVACGLALAPGYDFASIWAPLVLTALTVLVTLPLAWLNFTFVEVPGIRLGKALADRLQARTPVPAE